MRFFIKKILRLASLHSSFRTYWVSTRLKMEFSKFEKIRNIFFTSRSKSHFLFKLYFRKDKSFSEKYIVVLPPCPENSWIELVMFYEDILACSVEAFQFVSLRLQALFKILSLSIWHKISVTIVHSFVFEGFQTSILFPWNTMCPYMYMFITYW